MKVSQREARRLIRRVDELERILISQRRTYSQQWAGVNISTVVYPSQDDAVPTAIRTARRLGHAVVVVGDETGTLRFMALPHPKEPI